MDWMLMPHNGIQGIQHWTECWKRKMTSSNRCPRSFSVLPVSSILCYMRPLISISHCQYQHWLPFYSGLACINLRLQCDCHMSQKPESGQSGIPGFEEWCLWKRTECLPRWLAVSFFPSFLGTFVDFILLWIDCLRHHRGIPKLSMMTPKSVQIKSYTSICQNSLKA